MAPFIFALALVIIPGLVHSQTVTPTRFPDVVSALVANGHFTVFLDLLNSSGLLPRINSSAHFTIFAPTDDAFARLSADDFDKIKNNQTRLAEIVGFHVVLTTNYRIHGTQQDDVLKSSNNFPIRINTYNILHTVAADGVNITIKNIPILHGLAHGLDGVLTPPTQSIMQLSLNRPDISTFAKWVVDANLLNFFTNDKDVTVFIPNNAAFAKLSSDITTFLNSHHANMAETLKFHVVNAMTLFSIGMTHSISLTSGNNHHDGLMILQDSVGALSVNHAKIVEKDIITTDGVVHIIDSVLVPPRVLVALQDQGIVVG
ncbi:periostin-like [Physella acuta]|uniref:periostin-like n=1 Tax=Physella acuta TaxID=109671 RepID=UPI0027DD6A14|nr:periostin-like [Physella acuta]